jgi:hypothetical protein
MVRKGQSELNVPETAAITAKPSGPTAAATTCKLTSTAVDSRFQLKPTDVPIGYSLPTAYGKSAFLRRLAIRRTGLWRAICVLSLAILFVLEVGCGTEDYQKPIQQFEDASTVVINTIRLFSNNMNVIQQNEVLDNVVFERKPLDLPGLNKVEIISPDEIRIRTNALDALTIKGFPS